MSVGVVTFRIVVSPKPRDSTSFCVQPSDPGATPGQIGMGFPSDPGDSLAGTAPDFGSWGRAGLAATMPATQTVVTNNSNRAMTSPLTHG